MADSDHGFDGLADALSDLFDERVTLQCLNEQQFGAARIAIVEMEYRQSTDQGPSRHVAQTAAVLNDPELNLPEFSLQPPIGGLLGKLVFGMVGMNAMQFQDSPEFSEKYHLLGWNESAVRMLFTKELRDQLVELDGWSARGRGPLLVVFRAGEVCGESERPKFTDASLRILTLFQHGEETLDDHPEVRRETSVQDVYDKAAKMGGIQGSLVRSALNRLSISSGDLEAFLNQPKPRSNIPRGLKRQVIGETVFLTIFGLMFLVLGLAVPLPILLTAEDNERWIAIPFLILFPLIGGLVTFFSTRHRWRKKRLLQHGNLVDGKIKEVKRTEVEVNGARRYRVEIEYEQNGTRQAGIMNLYRNVEAARAFKASGQSVRVLVDPNKPDHVLCVDTLIVMD
jgi:hypothetical protein